MASAGQAQAHSSHPTHFSRPSGCLLRTCRPWKRGIVVFFCSGYNSVLTGLNIVANVTPNPLTGPKKLPIGASLVGGLGSRNNGCLDSAQRHHGARGARTDGLAATQRQLLPRHRRHRESTGVGIERREVGEILVGLL